MDYSELNLHPDLARGIAEAGYVSCMPVQAETFPLSFQGHDIYAQSQTGTGKTAAFLVSIFQRIMTVDAVRHHKVLILAPTRELAAQIETEAKKLGKHLPISMGSFYGGVSYGPQVDMLRDNVQVIIGTPGRIIDLVQQGKMLLRDVGFLVVDEAGRMFDMGFIDDLRKLLRYLPPAKERQTFLYSATLNFRVKNLTWEYMNEPKEIVIESDAVTVDLVTQELYHVGSDEKIRVLLGLLAREKPQSALVFCNQKFMAEELARRLGINGYECEYIMGDLPQAKRLQVIERLKAGKIALLVATDVAARGLDVNGLDLVVNFDVPMEAESYVHRIGRTARAGAAGKAITLACEKFVYGLPAIERYIESKIPVLPVTEELMVEDKSANMRYGHGRDRVRSGPDNRDRRPGGKSTAGQRRPGASRTERPAYQTNATTSARSTRDGRPRPERARSTEAHADARRPDRGVERNPYSMSAEERMNKYRQKYSGPAAAKNPSAPASPSQQPARQPAKQGSRKPAGQQSSQQQTSRQPSTRPSSAKPSSARPSSAQPASQRQQTQRPAQKPAAQPAAQKKPGILERIKNALGLGKRKADQ